MKPSFSHKILILGYGAVARCFLTLLLKHIEIPRKNILILDPLPPDQETLNLMRTGVKYYRSRILKTNYEAYLSQLLNAGDVLVQLGWLIDSFDLMQWCRQNNILYLNSGSDAWASAYSVDTTLPQKIAAYTERLLTQQALPESQQGSTAVILHGANCGLVSHFVKAALEDMAHYVLTSSNLPSTEHQKIKAALDSKQYALLAHGLGINAVHISELDTQFAPTLEDMHGFFNTWSIGSATSELSTPPQFAWGTHEQNHPQGANVFHANSFTYLSLPQKAWHIKVKSWIPSQGTFSANLVFHEETFTIADYLTLYDGTKKIYAPTVLFAYQVCPQAVKGMELVEQNGFTFLPAPHQVITHEIASGADELGILLLSETHGAWWTGSVLDIHTARKHTPNSNATSLQVAASLLAALVWLIEHPKAGIRLPETIPHEEILPIAKPYLGEYLSKPAKFSLSKNAKDSPWQFNDFLTN